MENPTSLPLYPIRRAMTLCRTLIDSSVIYAARSKPYHEYLYTLAEWHIPRWAIVEAGFEAGDGELLSLKSLRLRKKREWKATECANRRMALT